MNAPDPENLWNSLPEPAFITDFAGKIRAANPAAELFLNQPAPRLAGRGLTDVLCNDPALGTAFARLRDDQGPVYVNNVTLLKSATGCDADIQMSPMAGAAEQFLVLVKTRRFAGSLAQGDAHKSAARSAIAGSVPW